MEWDCSSVRVLSGGSLLETYIAMEKKVLESENVARFLGYLRIKAWDEEQWFLTDIRCFMRGGEEPAGDAMEGKSEVEMARKMLLENVPERFVKLLEQFDSLRGIRLSLMRVFEQFQSELLCKNLCLHLLDVLVATLFPEIEVWSHLVEEAEDSENDE